MDIFTSAAMVTISGTAIQSNTAGGNGGGINNTFGPALSLTSCSISGNTAGNYGQLGAGPRAVIQQAVEDAGPGRLANRSRDP